MAQIDDRVARRIEAEVQAITARAGLAFQPAASRFWFLRHGRTASNHKGLAQGHIDIELDEVGRQQARRAGSALCGVGLRRAVSSDLRRASETAELAAREIGLGKPELDASLRERCFGILEGTPKIAEAWLSTAPGAESLETFARRTLLAVSGAASVQDVLVCAHGGTLRVLSAALGITLEVEHYQNAVPLCFEREGRDWRCRLLGGDARAIVA